jgi:hypothetical protein
MTTAGYAFTLSLRYGPESQQGLASCQKLQCALHLLTPQLLVSSIASVSYKLLLFRNARACPALLVFHML